MTRQELIQAVSRRTMLTAQQADSALAAVIGSGHFFGCIDNARPA